MYDSFGTQGPSAVFRQVAVARKLFSVRVSHTVVLLGLTSMFTDISTEMVNAVLPLYLVFSLGFTPLHFGIFEGVYQGITALVRIAGGLVADRRGRYKEVAGAGYALSAACKLGLWSAGPAWGPTLGLLFLDRTGKGVRTAPRDALISLSSAPSQLAGAFGVHRALDTAGALIGPILAFVLLGLVPGGYDVVFIISFCLGVIGLGVLLFFVSNAEGRTDVTGAPASMRTVATLLRHSAFRGVVIAGALLSLGTVGDAFIYLTFQRRASMTPQYFPLLFVGTAVVYLALAVPLGRLADQVGHRRLFLTGHVLLVAAYALLLPAEPGLVKLVACLTLLGAYYACTDGVLMAIAGRRVPTDLMTSGLAVVTTVTALGRLVAATTYGALWTWWGAEKTLVLFALGLLAATVAARLALGQRSGRVEPRAA